MQEAANFGPAFSIPQKALKSLLGQVAFAMAVQDIRYYLNGILFVAEGKTLSLVATDGHRLAFASATLDIDVPKQEVILPRKTVLELQRLLSEGGGDSQPHIEMQFANNQAKFTFDGMEFVTKLVEGKFPDYNRVIPRSHGNTITLGRAPFLASLQRTAIMTSDKFKGVRLNLEPGSLRVTSNNAEQEEAVDELDIDYGGEPEGGRPQWPGGASSTVAAGVVLPFPRLQWCKTPSAFTAIFIATNALSISATGQFG